MKKEEVDSYGAVEINPIVDPDRPYESPEEIGSLKKLDRVTYKTYNKKEADEGIWGKMKRCAVTHKGELVAYHHPDNTNYWEDGTLVNWKDYEDKLYNCMVQIPKVYYKFLHGKNERGDRVVRYMISDTPDEENGFKLHPAFDRPNHQADFVYVSAFEGSQGANGDLRSLPYKNPPYGSITLFRKLVAGNKVKGHIQMDFSTMSLIQLLYITEYGNTDSQSKLGVGSYSNPTGWSLRYGNHSTNSKTLECVSYRGIENIYGNNLTYVDGAIVDKYNLFVSNNYEKYETEDVKDPSFKDYGLLADEGWTTHMRVYEDHRDYAFIPHKTSTVENPPGYYNDLFTSGRGYGPLLMSYQMASPSMVGSVHYMGGMFFLTSEHSFESTDASYKSRIQFLD